MSGLQRLKAFAKSPHHAWLALLTVGVGVATAEPVFAIAGVAAYALGWVFGPDTSLFKKWLHKKQSAHSGIMAEQEKHAFAEQRMQLYRALSHPLQVNYDTLAGLASEIEQDLRDNPTAAQSLTIDSQLHQIDALMWTYLRLLHTEEALKDHLGRERRENLPQRIRDMPAEIAELEQEISQLEQDASKQSLLQTRQRLLESQRERLAMLQKRATKVEESQANLELAESEQRRVVGLVKLLASELRTASQDAGDFSRHINSSASQIGQTNDWLAQLDELELDDDFEAFPQHPEARVGFSFPSGNRNPPPIPSGKGANSGSSSRSKNTQKQ
ncbi:MAG: hypothetical protein ACI9R3_002831 [Verrucomicrobiales bacterium]|jgi:hypothetical protein